MTVRGHWFDWDQTEELEQIKKNYSNIRQLINSISDQASKYRILSEEIEIEYTIFTKMLRKIEQTLLIDCYTLAEKMLKSAIYQVLEYESNENDFLQMFLSRSIRPEIFSPKSNFADIQRELNSLCKDKQFILILSKGHSAVRSYDEMILSRHKYAHANIYPAEIDLYADVINVLEYLVFEYDSFVMSIDEHMEMVRDFDEIKGIVEKCKKFKNEEHLKNSENVTKLVTASNKFVKSYREEWSSIELLSQIIDKLEEIGVINLETITHTEVNGICAEFLRGI